jgi:uncharacterized lipoprotein YddW (UPF0748 family)
MVEPMQKTGMKTGRSGRGALRGVVLGAAIAGAAWTWLPGCSAAKRLEAAFTPEPRTLTMTEPLRGVWVTRWDYRTPEDVRTIMRNLAQMGFTDVFWQVRGQGDAYYKSPYEPWGEAILRDSPGDTTPPGRAEADRGPGFDPLELAVREAHSRGMRLHAWMNVMPLWKGKAEPVSPSHPWLAKRAWRLKDDKGAEQPLSDGYVIANPVLEAVQDHIVTVARDIVRRYKVDGIHLDYVRFVSEGLEKDRWYPGDSVSLALYREARGLPDGKAVEPEAVRAWVRERISELVRRIRAEAVDSRAGVTLTAAVWRRPDLARDQQLQDAASWANRGWVDVVIPMIYTASDAEFRDDLRAWTQAVTRRGAVAPGVGIYLHESGRQTAGQVRMHAGDTRFVLFAYNSMFHSAAAGSLDTPQAETERLRRRVPLRAVLQD